MNIFKKYANYDYVTSKQII